MLGTEVGGLCIQILLSVMELRASPICCLTSSMSGRSRNRSFVTPGVQQGVVPYELFLWICSLCQAWSTVFESHLGSPGKDIFKGLLLFFWKWGLRVLKCWNIVEVYYCFVFLLMFVLLQLLFLFYRQTWFGWRCFFIHHSSNDLFRKIPRFNPWFFLEILESHGNHILLKINVLLEMRWLFVPLKYQLFQGEVHSCKIYIAL